MEVSEAVFWDWAIRGLGGIVTVLERLGKDGPRISAEHHDLLIASIGRLDELATVLDDRRVDSGAPLIAEHSSDVTGPVATPETPI